MNISGKKELPVKIETNVTPRGKIYEIGVNGKFLLTCLNACNDDVTLYFSTPNYVINAYTN
jgi:hypothetical protein